MQSWSMSWFGRRGAGVAYQECPQTETPVGSACRYCDEAVQSGDDGWVYIDGTIMHQECHLRGIIGSVAHQEKRCSCFGGKGSDEEDGMTRREGARAAMRHFESRPIG